MSIHGKLRNSSRLRSDDQALAPTHYSSQKPDSKSVKDSAAKGSQSSYGVRPIRTRQERHQSLGTYDKYFKPKKSKSSSRLQVRKHSPLRSYRQHAQA